MANAITLAKKYVPLLDEVYKKAALTSVLDSDPTLAREGANANEIVIPKIDMDGLADYDRNSGYVNGDVTLTWETVKFNYERGRMFNVDAMDNEETAGLAFGKLAGEFIRTKVVPEVDAFRFATYASTPNVTVVSADLATGEEVIKALRAASTKMDEDEVPAEGRILYITPTLKGLVDDLDTNKSKEVMKKFSQIIEVPQSRFYSAIELNDGKTVGEEKGGFKKATAAKDLNFMIFEPSALIQFPKHVMPKVIDPKANQKSDGWLFGYRNYGIADAYENKTAGIYAHTKA
ncbi:hypothetical protein [Clostridium culturomicium]|uniref:hypothetical protein n=1 Tax=Clostridium culturomicium TaxID=1499683 RepID=UPI003857BA3B